MYRKANNLITQSTRSSYAVLETFTTTVFVLVTISKYSEHLRYSYYYRPPFPQ
jgi:hypothetical protein